MIGGQRPSTRIIGMHGVFGRGVPDGHDGKADELVDGAPIGLNAKG